ncbi:MAG TPA: type IV pilus modification protein PilV [Gammaproteobacteria bacterium]|nr:type IV pilus modification protein PilV [Gammaproteobacteria bacterium]
MNRIVLLITITKSQHNFRRGRRKQAGSSLLEALVSLLVFSVGALGIAALQVTTVLRVDDSRQRSVAVWKAQEFVERIRASHSSKHLVDSDAPNQNETAQDKLTHYLGSFSGSSLSQMSNYSSQPNFICAPQPAKQCSVTAGASASYCSAQEIAGFDVWSTFCDPLLGVGSSALGAPESLSDGAVSLKGFDVALLKAEQGYNLYIRWIARDAEQNQSFSSAGSMNAPTRPSSQCAEDIELDVRLGMYCTKIH